MIRLYGVVHSRAYRCLWMLEELQVDYELVKTDFVTGDQKHPDYLQLNPNAHVPTLQDGDLVLWESLAINLYLAEKYGQGGLWPADVADHGRAYQWSLWAVTELEGLLLKALLHRGGVPSFPEDKRREDKAQEAERDLAKPLGVLDGALAGRAFLLGDTFTVADLNVASVMSWARLAKVSLDPYSEAKRWLKACMGRPTFSAVNRKHRAA